MILDALSTNYTRNRPTVLTAYSVEDQEDVSEDESTKRHKMKRDKEKVLIYLILFNGIILLLLIFMFLIPIYTDRNCLNH